MGLVFESTLWDVLSLLAVIAAFVYHYLTSTYTFWEKLDVPYIKPELFYGNMKEVIHFKKSQVELFQEFYEHFKGSGHKFGGIFQMRAPILFVCCPELAKDIYIKSFPHFHDRHLPYDVDFDPLSATLISLEGQKWKFLRSRLTPAFSMSKIKGMISIVREIADDYMETLRESAESGEMVELKKSVSLYLMDVIGAIAFGLRLNAQKEESDFLLMGQKFFEPTKLDRISHFVILTFPWLYKLFKLRTCPKKLTNFFMGVLKETMDHRRANNIQQTDFLHFLMKFKEEKGANLRDLDEMKGISDYNMAVNENSLELTEGVIAAQAFMFFLAGYETSASTLSSCIHILAEHPKVQDELLREVSKILQQFGDFTYEAIQNLTYTEQVIEETLRLFPPVGLNFRKCTKPYVIPGTDKIIPEGCQVFLPTHSFHRDPELFPDPDEFKPERFSPENRDKLVPCSFMAFGHGPRICIGSRLAMMEMKLSLALVVKNFKIVKCERTKPVRISPTSFFLTAIDGLWIRLIKRERI